MSYTILKKTNYDKKCVYIIPFSSKEDQFGVIYPVFSNKKNINYEEFKHLTIQSYTTSSLFIENTVKDDLINLINDKLEEYKKRSMNLRYIGFILIAFGVINLIMPDPIILLDDLLILTGGGIILGISLKIKKELPLLSSQYQNVTNTIQSINVEKSNLCSMLFDSIKAKKDLTEKEELIENLEKESKWYIDFADIKEMIKLKKIDATDLKNIFTGLKIIIPFYNILNLEKRLQRIKLNTKNYHKLVLRIKKMKQEICKKCGMSENALSAYLDLYESAKQYFDEKGEKF